MTHIATKSRAGLMGPAHVKKLDGIEAGANVTNATTVGSAIHGSSAKATPVDADTVALIDSAASNTLKKLSWANIKATLKSYFDTLYAVVGHSHSNATTSAAGFMSATDKSKLDGIEAGAQVNSVTSVAGKTGAVILNAADVGADLLSGFRNKIINGDFDIWQRGPGPFAGTAYTADRWLIGVGGGGDVVSTSRQSFSPGQTEVPGNPKHFLRFSRTTTGSATSFINQRIEDVRTLAGRLVTYTFWARANKALSVGVGYFQHFGSGGSATVDAYPETISVGTTWAKYSVTMTWPSVSGKTIGDGSYVAFRLSFPAGNGNFTFDLAHVSVVDGDATAEDDPFSPRHIQQELALCQRYYLRLGGTENYERLAAGFCHTATLARTVVFFPTEMRAPPSLSYNGAISIENPSGNTAVTSLSANEPCKLTCGVNAEVSTGLTAGHGCFLTAHNDFNAHIAFDAEL